MLTKLIHSQDSYRSSRAVGLIAALLFATLLSISTAHAQVAPPAAIKDIFPDPALATAVSKKLNKNDTNAIVTQDELVEITELTIDNPQSFAGSEYMLNLKFIVVWNINETRQLESLPNTLTELRVVGHMITQLPAKLPPRLSLLHVNHTAINSLPDTLPASLQDLRVEYNQLTQLPDTLPAGLTVIYAYYNRLTHLPDTLPDSLRHLWVNNNQLTQLPDTLPASLPHLYIANNRLTRLPDTLPASIETITAFNNQLTHLPDTLPVSLRNLSVSDNRLTQLPATLPASLEYLDVNHNQLMQLPDTLPASLERLYAINNQLTQLPDTLPASLMILAVSNNQLTHLPDSLTSNICFLFAAYNQLVQYSWPVPASINEPCAYSSPENYNYYFESDNRGQWVTLPTLQRSLGSAFDFDDFAPPILQHFKDYAGSRYYDLSAGTLAKKGQWTLTTPDGSTKAFAAGDGSEINVNLFTMSGLYRLSFEVITDDGYFNLKGSTYTRAIIIDRLDPQAHQTMQASASATVDATIGRTDVYANFSPQAAHLDQDGALFIFAYLPNTIVSLPDTLWIKDNPSTLEYWWEERLSTEWRLFTDCSLVRPVYKGKIGFLQNIAALTYWTYAPETSAIANAELYVGYGMGTTTEQACRDLTSNQRYQKIYTMP